jgi:hypothetical protein
MIKKIKQLFLLALAPNLCFGQVDKIIVKNSLEFIDAIKSNRIIELAAGLNINDIPPYMEGEFYFIDQQYDAHTLVLRGLHNLEIVGQGLSPVEVLNSNVNSEVLEFQNCANIKIRNINAGHGPRKGEQCYGGVLNFDRCQGISVDKSILYGSGSEGITAYEVKGLKCVNTTIFGCTHAALSLDKSSEISIKNCEIFENDFYDLFRIYDCSNFVMESCKIERNHVHECVEHDIRFAYHSLFDVNESLSVVVRNCKINNNVACYLLNSRTALQMDGTTLDNNDFSTANFFEN